MAARLGKQDLLQRILWAVRSSGWNAIVLSQTPPFRLSIFDGNTTHVVLCYIWNMTHGGYPRNPNELRIHITGVDQFRVEAGGKTLLLGWNEEERMFAGFDVAKHLIPMKGRSPSLQVRRETLQTAKVKDFFPQIRGNKENVIAFRPEFFVTYVLELEDLHGAAQRPVDIKRLEEIATRDIEWQVKDVPAGPRKTVMEKIKRKVRDARFRKNVIAAYGFRCAMSDMQLDLLDAAHIIPVEHSRGTDETRNGLCLSALHHRAFDQGLIGIKRNYSIIFNEEQFNRLRALGWDGGESEFKKTCRDAINLPKRKEFYPDWDYLILGQVLRGWNEKAFK